MRKIAAPDVQPWEPKLETTPMFNPFMTTTNPSESLDEAEVQARGTAGLDAPSDEPISPITDRSPRPHGRQQNTMCPVLPLSAPLRVAARKAAVIVCTMAGAIWLASAQPAEATQQFATQTGEACGQCHVSPKGAGALSPAGQAFKANGNKVPKDHAAESTSPAPTPLK